MEVSKWIKVMNQNYWNHGTSNVPLLKTNNRMHICGTRHSQNSNQQRDHCAGAVPSVSGMHPASTTICNHFMHSESKTAEDLTSWMFSKLIHANFYLKIRRQQSNSHEAKFHPRYTTRDAGIDKIFWMQVAKSRWLYTWFLYDGGQRATSKKTRMIWAPWIYSEYV